MEVYERINQILKDKNMTKSEFANRLILLKPRLKHTGESPCSSTIMHYLNGKRELKIELIPYIAEVLGVFEQELFCDKKDNMLKFYSNFSENTQNNDEIKNIILLLKYAPPMLLEKIEQVLEQNKENITKSLKKLE